MNMPGFTADSAHYQSRVSYRVSRSQQTISASVLSPALVLPAACNQGCRTRCKSTCTPGCLSDFVGFKRGACLRACETECSEDCGCRPRF
jgi:hypothetical protein